MVSSIFSAPDSGEAILRSLNLGEAEVQEYERNSRNLCASVDEKLNATFKYQIW